MVCRCSTSGSNPQRPVVTQRVYETRVGLRLKREKVLVLKLSRNETMPNDGNMQKYNVRKTLGKREITGTRASRH